MGVPLAIAAVTMALAGSVQQTIAARSQAEYQAQVAKNNAVAANQAASDAIQRGQIEERNQRLKTAAIISQERVAAASRGGVVDSGSNLDLLKSDAYAGEIDALTIRNNAQREATNYQNQSSFFRGQQDLANNSKTNATIGGVFDFGSTLIGGASNVADKWYASRKTSSATS